MTSPTTQTTRWLIGTTAGLVGAAVGVGLWVVIYEALRITWIPPILCGLTVGMAMRLTPRRRPRFLSALAVVLAFAASYVGYIVVDVWYMPWITPPQRHVADAARDFFAYFDLVALTALGCYLAFVLTQREQRVDPGQDPRRNVPDRD